MIRIIPIYIGTITILIIGEQVSMLATTIVIITVIIISILHFLVFIAIPIITPTIMAGIPVFTILTTAIGVLIITTICIIMVIGRATIQAIPMARILTI